MCLICKYSECIDNVYTRTYHVHRLEIVENYTGNILGQKPALSRRTPPLSNAVIVVSLYDTGDAPTPIYRPCWSWHISLPLYPCTSAHIRKNTTYNHPSPVCVRPQGPVSQKILSPLVILSREKSMVTMVISELKFISRLKIFRETGPRPPNCCHTRNSRLA